MSGYYTSVGYDVVNFALRFLSAYGGEAVSGRLPSKVSFRDVPPENWLSMEQIIFQWTGTEAINSTSRGPNMDARKLAALEKLFGESFTGTTGANPTSAAAIPLNESYRVQKKLDMVIGCSNDELPCLSSQPDLHNILGGIRGTERITQL